MEGLSDWIPHIKGYEREKSLRETLEETKIVKEDTQQRKKIQNSQKKEKIISLDECE